MKNADELPEIHPYQFVSEETLKEKNIMNDSAYEHGFVITKYKL